MNVLFFEMDVKVTFLCVSFYFLSINSYSPSKTKFSPSELHKSDIISNSTLKAALRYGFHRVTECDDFEKAYICLQKCVDLGYDIAYSDKYCFCTCYVKEAKAKYSTHLAFTKTKWRLGAPTTTRPVWADKNKKLQSKVPYEGDPGKDNENNDVVNDGKFIKYLNNTEHSEATNNTKMNKDELGGLNITSNNSATENSETNLNGTENIEATTNITENVKQNINATEDIGATSNVTITTSKVEDLNATSNSNITENTKQNLNGTENVESTTSATGN